MMLVMIMTPMMMIMMLLMMMMLMMMTMMMMTTMMMVMMMTTTMIIAGPGRKPSTLPGDSFPSSVCKSSGPRPPCFFTPTTSGTHAQDHTQSLPSDLTFGSLPDTEAKITTR